MAKTKKSLAMGAMALSLGLLVSACSSSSDNTTSNAPQPTDPQPTSVATLTVWVDQERVDALQGAATDYQDKTGIQVNIVGRDNSTLKDDFIQQANSGSGPDVIMGAHDWVGELTTNGVVAPIELADKADQFMAVARDAAYYEGSAYLLPYGVENLAILRNADLAPNSVATYDEMIAAGEASGAEFAFVVEQGVDGNPYHLYPFQTAFGAPVFGRDASGSYDPSQLLLGEGEPFAQWLATQGKNGANNISTEITGDIAKEKFTSGEAAFWLTGPWNVKAAVDAGINVQVDAIPTPGPEAAQPFAGVKGFYVNEYSANKIAANDFLVNYIATEAVQVALFESGGVLPALQAAADVASADPIVAGFAAAGASAVPMPAIPAMGKVWEYWGIAQAAVLNGADPASTWQKLTADVQAAISE